MENKTLNKAGNRMEEKVKVSVIIPVYNAEQYLAQCLDGVVNQTLGELEIILVNDGSTDGSQRLMRKYQKRDARIQIVDQENQGPAMARNAGLRLAKGEYLAFLDADDFFAPEMLETLYKSCVEQDADVGVVRSREYDERTRECNNMKFSVKEEFLPGNNPFSYHDVPDCIFNIFKGWAWDKLFRRAMVEEHHLEFQNLKSSEDMLFVYMSLVHANRIYVIDNELAYHRINVGTSVSSSREKSWKCFYTALVQMKADLLSAGIYDEVEKSFINWVAEFTTWQMFTFQDRKVFLQAFQLMHEEGIKFFGVMEHGESYFYMKHEYDFCKFLQEKDLLDCVDVLFKRLENERDNLVKERDDLLKALGDSRAEVGAVRNSTTYRLGEKILWLPCKILGKE